MGNNKYKQCKLEKKVGVSTHTQVSFIPKEFAVLGRVIKLKQDDDTWDDGWKVVSVGSEESDAIDYRKRIRSHRNATGDSLPKNDASVV